MNCLYCWKCLFGISKREKLWTNLPQINVLSSDSFFLWDELLYQDLLNSLPYNLLSTGCKKKLCLSHKFKLLSSLFVTMTCARSDNNNKILVSLIKKKKLLMKKIVFCGGQFNYGQYYNNHQVARLSLSPSIVGPVGLGCRIRRLLFCRGVRLSQPVSWIWL